MPAAGNKPPKMCEEERCVIAEPSEREGRQEGNHQAWDKVRLAVQDSGPESEGVEDVLQVGSSETHPDVLSQSTK